VTGTLFYFNVGVNQMKEKTRYVCSPMVGDNFSFTVDKNNLKKAKYMAAVYTIYNPGPIILSDFNGNSYLGKTYFIDDIDQDEFNLEGEYISIINDIVVVWGKTDDNYAPSATILGWAKAETKIQFIEDIITSIKNSKSLRYDELEFDLFSRLELCINEDTSLVYEISHHRTLKGQNIVLSFDHDDFIIKWGLV
jgi:hypothetical protein